MRLPVPLDARAVTSWDWVEASCVMSVWRVAVNTTMVAWLTDVASARAVMALLVWFWADVSVTMLLPK